ncbi:uroporphyrinogen-III synthase [Granulicella mallensis]|uniref:Uroporphyrinogen-III synthase n=1 Tax=Granulicella mallensis TaxID=940614 RepID=A0A7W8E6Z2_9BACT|nr:uroporphyrinogen-III synthase [Granulicella mallensis]MBB5061743.1 uroporphyrinogen-III synthase [Granulicella mallensis]
MTHPRVLITRAPHQVSELAESLRAAGIEPILIPAIETVEPTSFAPLDAALSGIDTFHWLLFTSANAVEAFNRRLGVLKGVGRPSVHSFHAGTTGLKVAAIGPATARAVEVAGLQVDLTPTQAVAESLAAALLPHARQPDGTPTRFLLVRAEQARDHLPDTLCAAGAEVTIAPAYRTVIPESSIPTIRELFVRPENYPEAITFTSSSTAHNLVALLEAAGLVLPPDILRASIGPITSQTLVQLGFPPHVEAKEPSVPSLVAAIVGHFKSARR